MDDNGKTPEISVVIRSHNDSALIEKTLCALSSQSIRNIELIGIDDSSTDGTKEILKKYSSLRLYSAPSPYVPGKIVNYALSLARAEIVVFNNSDAIPLTPFYLEELTKPFSDKTVCASFANQIPRGNALPLVRKDYERAFGDGTVSASWKNFFSLAGSALKKSLALENPFDETLAYSEDIEWTFRMRAKGFRTIYVPSAMVEHSHNYSPAELRKRFYNEGKADCLITGNAPRFGRTILSLGAELLRDYRYLLRRGEFAFLLTPFTYRIPQRFSAYRGAMDAMRERGKR